MRSHVQSAGLAACLLMGTALYGTNGDRLIGVGAKARGMGGVGNALMHGAESAVVNPALIGEIGGSELFVGTTLFMPDVAADAGYGMTDSDARMSLIPELAVVTPLGGGFSGGIGMFGTAGMGVDYSDSAAHMRMETKLQLMQLVAPLAYRYGDVAVGVSPILQYGSLKISYMGSSTGEEADDVGIGFNAGVSYRLGMVTLGAVYRSAIDMTYRNQLSKAAADFALLGINDHLEQPSEYGVGASWHVGAHTAAFDYSRIGWSDAEGYRDFGWRDQNVYAFGYSYARERWSLRAGINYGKSPIRPATGSGATMINTMNLLGFPAIAERHFSLGCSFDMTPRLTVDAAFTHAPRVQERYPGVMGPITTTHAQQALTFGMTYGF